ncbi:hypothetical protein DS832_01520 [Bombilactobacillus bombi]|uniref:Lipoprotein n=1 Tax=Bombilactobacillus bombi TaxID=1303590 RepID=A0A417ZCE5_9LACO|nr:hypothetical protein [Bombilactobacillus bombi]RHW48271.1 hypothetical protein DS832_01520 [Bombilactobacillus bombi]
MKKILVSIFCSLFILGSYGCANNNQSSHGDNKPKTTHVEKHKAKHKTKKHVAKKKSDNDKKTQTSQSDNQQQQTQQSNEQQNAPQNQQQAQPQTSTGISYDTDTLTGFLNTYGLSPVAYKIKNGMSSYDALKSTPNSMKTSGEMQTEYAMDQGYMDHNGNEVQQPAQNNQDQ